MIFSPTSLLNLVHEIVDVTPTIDQTMRSETNRYASEIEAALSRSRATGLRQCSSDVNAGPETRTTENLWLTWANGQSRSAGREETSKGDVR
jgi:hypothetical protein